MEIKMRVNLDERMVEKIKLLRARYGSQFMSHMKEVSLIPEVRFKDGWTPQT